MAPAFHHNDLNSVAINDSLTAGAGTSSRYSQIKSFIKSIE